MKTLFLILALSFPVLAFAEAAAPTPSRPAVTPTATTSSLDTNKDGKVDASETSAVTTADASAGEVAGDAAKVVDAAKSLKDPTLPKGLAIAVLLGAIFKLLLSGLKVVSKFAPWFKSQDGKRVLKYSTLGLGAAAALTANLAFGMGWMDALTILLSGPLAVAIHEYTSDSKPTETVKA